MSLLPQAVFWHILRSKSQNISENLPMHTRLDSHRTYLSDGVYFVTIEVVHPELLPVKDAHCVNLP